MSAGNHPKTAHGASRAWQGYRPVRIRPPERDAIGNVETPLSPDEQRVAVRDGWTWAPAHGQSQQAGQGASA